MKLQDDRPATRARTIHYRPAWGFKGSQTKSLIRKELADAPHPQAHVCSGPSNIGELRVDLEHPAANIRADAFHLPFRNLGTILIDPPWQIDLPARARMLNQCQGALAPKGRLLLYANWMPGFGSMRLLRAWVRLAPRISFPYPPVLLTVWEKDVAR